MKKEKKNMDKNTILDDIFSDDAFWLLEVKQKSSAVSAEDRLIQSFEEINSFYKHHDREPEKTSWKERNLYSRLQGMRTDQYKIDILKKYDTYNLLSDIKERKEITSIDDIFESDDLWIFDSLEEKKDIFKIVHVPEIDTERIESEMIAHRDICENFEEYEHLFISCQDDLREKKRKILPYDETRLEQWMFCVLNGVLLYIAKVEKEERGNNGRLNRRTLLIFENGTQSNMLLRSLWKRLNENGKIVTAKLDNNDTFFTHITDEDLESWYIYVLSSLSEDDRIKTKNNLYKIWFSTTLVEERIKNAMMDPTYLMAPVKTAEVFKVFNVNPHKLENLIHRFFQESRLDIDIIDGSWFVYKPREWFIAPIDVIIEAIELIISGEIVSYKYNPEKESITQR